MCFKRTFAVFETIEAHIKREMPFDKYARGCHLIADAGSRILKKLGYESRIELIALKSNGAMIPHYISPNG